MTWVVLIIVCRICVWFAYTPDAVTPSLQGCLIRRYGAQNSTSRLSAAPVAQKLAPEKLHYINELMCRMK